MADYGLKDRVAIVTGANNPQGIGAATALALAREGAKVVLVYKKIPRPFDPEKTGCNGVDRYYCANAGDAAAVEGMLRELGADYRILERDISREEDVKDIYMIRSLLEGLCARWATEHITEEQLDEMEENVYLAKFHAKKGHYEQLAALDNRFHEIMYEACNSKMLEHQLKDFHDYVLRVRKKTLANVNRGTKSNEEHEMIMEAIKAKDADKAEALANKHMINAYENMVQNGLHEAYHKPAEK